MSGKARITLLLAIGWTVGLVAQAWVGLASGYADIFPRRCCSGSRSASAQGHGRGRRIRAEPGAPAHEQARP